jgi:hypothetical protein
MYFFFFSFVRTLYDYNVESKHCSHARLLRYVMFQIQSMSF